MTVKQDHATAMKQEKGKAKLRHIFKSTFSQFFYDSRWKKIPLFKYYYLLQKYNESNYQICYHI